jgi:hypothetical protein
VIEHRTASVAARKRRLLQPELGGVVLRARPGTNFIYRGRRLGRYSLFAGLFVAAAWDVARLIAEGLAKPPGGLPHSVLHEIASGDDSASIRHVRRGNVARPLRRIATRPPNPRP